MSIETTLKCKKMNFLNVERSVDKFWKHRRTKFGEGNQVNPRNAVNGSNSFAAFAFNQIFFGEY